MATVGLYHLEDETDSSGNGYNLTNTGGVTFTAGRFGNAANFGAANSTKRLNINSNLGITTGNITLSIWVKCLAEIASSQWVFVMQLNSAKLSYDIRYDYNAGTRRLGFVRNRYGTATDIAYYTITLGTANWYNMILTYNGANVIGYVNGSQVGTIASTGVGATAITDRFSIGDYDADTNHLLYSSTMIDEVIVDNTAWSAAQVAAYYVNPQGSNFFMFF